MQVSSSMATTEPEPSMVPFLPTSSWSRGRSSCSGPNQYDEAPPGMKALSVAVASDAAAVDRVRT